MDYEEVLKKAYDLMADFQDEEARQLLEECIADIKESLSGTLEDAERYYYWGLALSALNEPRQALLKFEQTLNLKPDHESALWEVASTLLYELDNPQSAKTIMEERLLPLFPGEEKYAEALRQAEMAIEEKLLSSEDEDEAEEP